MIKPSSLELKVLGKYIENISGLDVKRNNNLIESKLGPLVEEFNCSNYSELYFKAKTDEKKVIERKIIEAFLNKETYFFRDKLAFELLKEEIMPYYVILMKSNINYSLNILSIGCSTGQEVYSVAIFIDKNFPNFPKDRLKILGIDISDEAISKASYGMYSTLEVNRGLSQKEINKYFKKENKGWRIRDEIRAYVSFKRVNILNYTDTKKFDIVFCRYVAIYFTPFYQYKLFQRIYNQMKNKAYLILGASELLNPVNYIYFKLHKYKNFIFYEKRDKF